MPRPIDLYIMPGSAPCRAIWMTAKALKIPINIKVVSRGDQLKPEFLKMNPQHTVPTIDDNGFYLWESRAIMQYFVDKYGKDDSLLPRDAQKRAIVNRILCFDMGTLYKALSEWLYPLLFCHKSPDSEKSRALKQALTYLNGYLENCKYLAGDTMTIADLSVLATVTFLEIKDYDYSHFKNIKYWIVNMKSELPYYEECSQGLYEWKEMIKLENKRKKNWF